MSDDEKPQFLSDALLANIHKPTLAQRYELAMSLMCIPVLDSDGNDTGETTSIITNPQEFLDFIKP